MVHNAHTYAQPWPPSQVQHTCHNVPASICSPAFFEEASTKEIYALKKKNHSVCVRMHWRERGYTHTCQGNMVMAFFFLSLLFQSVTIKIFPYSYDFFFWGGNISFFLFSSNQQRPQIFLVFFFITYMSYSLHKNRRCNKGKNSFTHTHTRTHLHAHSVVSVWPVRPHVPQGAVAHTDVGAVVTRRLLLRVIVVVDGRRLIFLGSSRHWGDLWRRRRRRRRRSCRLWRRWWWWHCLEWEGWWRRHVVTLALGVGGHVRRNRGCYQWGGSEHSFSELHAGVHCRLHNGLDYVV